MYLVWIAKKVIFKKIIVFEIILTSKMCEDLINKMKQEDFF